jgi:anion-transporting  ArsA/GET3 family ATPase
VGRFLNVNAEVSGLARVGPVHKQSESIMRLLRSETTAVHLVTLLEEMPVQESLDAIEELRGLGLPVGAIAVNRVRSSPLTKTDLRAAANGSMDTGRIVRGLTDAGLDHPSHPVAATATALVGEAAQLAERINLQRAQRRRLEEAGQPLIDLPEVQSPGTLAAVHELAETIREGLR